MDYLVQMDIMDCMEQSIIHIKAPHTVHISAKVLAARQQISMNQYIINLIVKDLETIGTLEDIQLGIDMYRANVSVKPKKPVATAKQPKMVKAPINGLCKIHGTPLTDDGKCLQKGCKWQ